MSDAGRDLCRHYGVCGSCRLLHLSYPDQLALKQETLGKTLEIWPGEIPIAPSPRTEYYRNKMEFSFSHQVKTKDAAGKPAEFENCLGQKLKGRWDKAFDIEECRIATPKAPQLLAAVRGWAAREQIEYYDSRKHTGCLRHLLLREGKNTGEFLVMLFVTAVNFDEAKFLDAAASVLPEATVLIGAGTHVADAAKAETVKLLRGSGFIAETLDAGAAAPVRVEISPFSFLQTNTKAAETLYKRVRRIAEDVKPGRLLDLYGGMGIFSLACGGLAGQSVCVESCAEAVEAGKRNAAINGIPNIEFHCAATEKFLPQNAALMDDSLVIVDPPRCGLHPDALAQIALARPKLLVYVSCNPKALQRDLKALAQSYKIDSVEGFDFFPHTEHIETLAVLSRAD